MFVSINSIFTNFINSYKYINIINVGFHSRYIVYIYIYICCIFILKPVVHVVSGERCVYSEKKTEQDNYY